LNHLDQATHPQPTNPAEIFTYDAVGNRTASHLATGQVHDVANRLLDDVNFTYAYDQNGNLTEKVNKGTGDRTVYTYDAENQLILVEQFTLAGGATPVLVAEYNYDALGRRIEKVVNGVSTRLVYDNEDLIAEMDASNIVRAIYVHGPGIDEPLAMFRSQPGITRFFFHADGLGSITHLTDAAGTVARSYTYDSFGQIVDQTGTVTNPYTYTAREFDPETGLYYYRARSYDPSVGRFLQEDPFPGALVVPQSLNKYPYVRNNPIKLTDPQGLSPDCRQKAREFLAGCVVTVAVLVDFPLGILLVGCATAGPGAVPCAAAVTIALEAPALVGVGVCLAEFDKRLEKCVRAECPGGNAP
jgi:RHS repeat-associated protein